VYLHLQPLNTRRKLASLPGAALHLALSQLQCRDAVLQGSESYTGKSAVNSGSDAATVSIALASFGQAQA